MNLRHAQTTIAHDPYQPDSTSSHLHGPWFLFARIVWIALVVLIMAFFATSIPAFIAILHNACMTPACHSLITPYTVKQIQESGISISFYLIFYYTVLMSVLFAFLTIGIVLFWLKSSEFMALYTSFALVTFAIYFTSDTLATLVPAWWLPINSIAFLGSVCFGSFFYLFPNGRFVPRWTRWLLVGWVFYSVVNIFFPHTPLGKSWLITLFSFCLLVSLVGTQVYRYWRVSSPLERQQTKWVVLGISIGLAGFLLVVFLYFDNALSIFQPGPRSDLIAGMALNVFIILIPLAIAFAILRSRLWDIDIIINRTLVYGTLTISLATVYVGLILGLQALLQAAFKPGNNDVAIVVSTLVIAALFQPLRRRFQAIIDRRFYRRKYNAAKTLASFSAALRNEVELDELSRHLVAIVEETMQPAQVSLWLRPPASATNQQVSGAVHPMSLKWANKREEQAKLL